MCVGGCDALVKESLHIFHSLARGSVVLLKRKRENLEREREREREREQEIGYIYREKFV